MGENPRAQSPISQYYLSHQAHSSNQTFNVSMQDDDDTDCSPHSRRILECQKISDRISTFCDQENLPQRVSFLNQELSVFGYPPIKSEHDESCASSPKTTSPNGFVNLVTLVNISYDLLRLWRQSMESQNEANDLQRTSESEIVRLKHIASRLKEDIASKDRDLKSKELLEHQLSQRLENLKKKLKAEQEKARRLTSEMTARDTQFKHEKKKKVQEIEKLQTRLHQLLQDKRQERMLGIEILNSLQRSDGKRGKWNTDRTKKNNEQDMYRLIINNYEDAQRQLLKENAGMRKYLKEMQDELISALNERTNISYDQTSQTAQDRLDESGERRPRSRTSSNASNASEKSDVSEPMSEGMFEMPYDLVKEDIEKSIRAKWKALKKEIRQTRKMNKRPPIAKGKANGDEYADLVHQQQELINYLTAGQGGSNERPIPEDSYFLEEKAELEKERSDFKTQKHALEKERKLYAEALLQLDEQRQAFEFEKSQWFQHNFLQLTPFRNEGRPSSSPHHNPRSKNSSSHQSRSSRQQPYHPRPSISPDKSSKASNHSSHNGTTRTPNGIDQCFSRLHSSSNRGSFSPDHPRRVEADWSNITPEQKISGFPHKAKSTPTNAIHQPSTAELYRKLGLVYDGSNKENEEMDNTGNESSTNEFPHSSGTPPNYRSFSSLKPILQYKKSCVDDRVRQKNHGGHSMTYEGHHMANTRGHARANYHLKASNETLGKTIPYHDANNSQGRSRLNKACNLDNESDESFMPLTEYCSAASSIESDSSTSHSEDYYDARKTLISSSKSLVKLSSNERQKHSKKSRRNSASGMNSAESPSSTSTLEDIQQESPNKLKEGFGIKNFISLLLGSPGSKYYETNPLKSYLTNSSPTLNSPSADDDSDVHTLRPSGHASPSYDRRRSSFDLEVYHQRTRSYPGGEVTNFGKLMLDCRRPSFDLENHERIKTRLREIRKTRSYSDSPVLSASAERHKSALLSVSANLKPFSNLLLLQDTSLDSSGEGTHSNSIFADLKYISSLDSPQNICQGPHEVCSAFDKVESGSFSPSASSTQTEIQKLTQKQFRPEIYEQWSHSSRCSSVLSNGKSATQLEDGPELVRTGSDLNDYLTSTNLMDAGITCANSA